MSWRPKLVALDIDGTVVDHAGRMPEAVFDAVQRVVEAGVHVVLATGRAWHGTQPVFDHLRLPGGPAISSNGAVTVSYPPQEITRAITFDPADVIRRVMEFAPDTLVAVEEVGRGYRLSDHFPPGDLTGELVIEDLQELGARPVTRVILRDPNRSDEDFVSLADHLGLHGVTYFVGYSAWIDIAPDGVNKATALADIAADLGVDQTEVLALGDGRNDIEMLTWAGRGVAIGDAPPEVKEAADSVTDRFDLGGTVKELLRWF
ncbi:HAD family hydrolase [Microlunatus panaciterrae]|uniref:Hydroxymethylpyrimidine pyrophosphatase-like HAD family hydrolase n=1 Tax=Microlunatus panaciterrae TaxID=400768 RepID=A0ABS2RLL7_9ACTN|nr:HAD family hydrolase [Microlunatus panaciterrae]MBM7799066.1 hydroxymethylpyrimidine pyrophosphatase-like HAD family hydrolase [Microlunatus panaciterrae]